MISSCAEWYELLQCPVVRGEKAWRGLSCLFPETQSFGRIVPIRLLLPLRSGLLVNRPIQNDVFHNATHSPRRAKIVCPIGPASDTEEMMRELMLLGMNVARLNFSHGTHEDHARVIRRLRKVAREL